MYHTRNLLEDGESVLDLFQDRKNQIECEDVYQWACPREIRGEESGLLPKLSNSSLNHSLNKTQNKGKYIC